MTFDSDDSDSDCSLQEDETSTGGQHEDDEGCPWRSAVDPRSGKTYYYHVTTRETQWRKPMEMASREECEALEAKERRQKEFFATMEANILKSISSGMKTPGKRSLLDEEYEDTQISDEPLAPSVDGNLESSGEIEWVPPQPSLERRSSRGGGAGRARPDLMRTISTMDTNVLRELIKRVPSSRNVRSSSSRGLIGSNHSVASTRSIGMGNSSHHSTSTRRRIHGLPQAGSARGMQALLGERSVGAVSKSSNIDSDDEPPPLTVVTTPDLRTSEMKRMGSLKLDSLKPERTNSLRLDQLSFEDAGNNHLVDSNYFGNSGGLYANLSNNSFHLDGDDSEPPELVNHMGSRSSFAGAGSFSSFDSGSHTGFDDSNNNSFGAHLSMSGSLHPVEEEMDESERSFPLNDPAKEIIVGGREAGDKLGEDNSFSLGAESDTQQGGAADWLDGLPDDVENGVEELVGYGKFAKPFKDAGYTSFFDESMANFDLSEEETQALQKLAAISEQMTHVLEDEEDDDEDEYDEDEDEDDGYNDGGGDEDLNIEANERSHQSFELNFEGSENGDDDEDRASLASVSESDYPSSENEEVKSSPSYQTPITATSARTPATSTSASTTSPILAAQRRTLAQNTRIPRKLRRNLVTNEESDEYSSQDEGSLEGDVAVASLAGATLTTDNARSHLAATLTTDNARSHLGATLTSDNAKSHIISTLTSDHARSHLAKTEPTALKTGSGGSSSNLLNNISRGRRKGGLSLASPERTPSLTGGSSHFRTTANELSTKPGGNATKRDMSKRPDLVRRNTCGTLYVGTTMSAPDKDATIKCVCGVYRAHILQSEMADDEESTQFRIFNDLESRQGRLPVRKQDQQRSRSGTPLPSLDQITTFYRDVFQRAQMEYDCIIISLIYVERLIKTTKGALRPRGCNWRSILFSCMVLASKVWDDLSMWNADFSQTCPSGVKFPLKRINELEVAILGALSYKVKVPASEYAKYYFLLRTMLIKSGLVGDNVDAASPLDVEGAKRLQQVSAQYQSGIGGNRAKMKRAKSMRNTGRSKSMGSSEREQLSEGARKAVSLEHVVKM